MLEIRKAINPILVCPKVNQTFGFYSQLNKNNIFERKERRLLIGPGVSGRPVELYQIARYDE